MPNWTDDEGNSWFWKTQCPHCLKIFEVGTVEPPKHRCVGGRMYPYKTQRDKDWGLYSTIQGRGED